MGEQLIAAFLAPVSEDQVSLRDAKQVPAIVNGPMQSATGDFAASPYPNDSSTEAAQYGSFYSRAGNGNTKVQWTSFMECRIILS
jgi:hypothetical protein